MIFIRENCETELTLEVCKEFKIIKRVDNLNDGRKVETIEKYDGSWSDETVRFFFVSRANAIVSNGGKIKNIL